ncbi:fimbrial protein [Providencia rettgeri]|uniref:fimbrial protein n=1 Tax=Providencia rettgeri TaxID=587 RepID=UPI0035263D81
MLLLGASCSQAKQVYRVTMLGSIVDTACAIDVGSYEQSIDMGILPLSSLKNQGYGKDKSFNINLIGCRVLSHDGKPWEAFEISFEGAAQNNWFMVFGSAEGVAISLLDSDGLLIYPGKKLINQNFLSGNQSLHYKLRLVSDGKPLRAGTYQSSIKFKINYY